MPSIFSSKPTFFVKRLDPGVAADAELAEPPRALVRVERAQQELLADARARVDDPARSKTSRAPETSWPKYSAGNSQKVTSPSAESSIGE